MELLLGTAQLLGNYGRFRKKQHDGNPCRILKTAGLEGFSGLDTAPTYRVEQTIGECGWPKKIHTKIQPNLDPEISLKRSLHALRCESVDVLYFHEPKSVNRSKSFFRAVRNRIPSETAGSLGLSIYSPAELEAAIKIPEITAVQVPLNIADARFSHDLLRRAGESNVRIYARSIFLQGALLQAPENLPAQLAPLRTLSAAIQQLAFRSGFSVAEICVAWVKALPGISGLVMGAESAQQVRELKKAFNTPLDISPDLQSIRSLQLDLPEVLDPREWFGS